MHRSLSVQETPLSLEACKLFSKRLYETPIGVLIHFCINRPMAPSECKQQQHSYTRLAR